MTAAKRLLFAALGAASFLTLSSASLANDANGERDPSIYDQNPDCMNRGQVPAGQPSPCELAVPGAIRRPRAPLGSNVAPAGGAASAAGAAKTAGSASADSSASSPQAAIRLRATTR